MFISRLIYLICKFWPNIGKILIKFIHNNKLIRRLISISSKIVLESSRVL